MTPDKYAEWTALHADLFGMRDVGDSRLFALWAPVLVPFEFEELRAASYAVATDAGERARYRTNHLQLLRANVFEQRADAAARIRDRREKEFATVVCGDCNGVGIVRVPHPSFVLDGELARPLYIGVACTCPLGNARFNAVNARLVELQAAHRLMDMAQYEGLVPEWRMILAARLETDDHAQHGFEIAASADKSAPINLASSAKARRS